MKERKETSSDKSKIWDLHWRNAGVHWNRTWFQRPGRSGNRQRSREWRWATSTRRRVAWSWQCSGPNPGQNEWWSTQKEPDESSSPLMDLGFILRVTLGGSGWEVFGSTVTNQWIPWWLEFEELRGCHNKSSSLHCKTTKWTNHEVARDSPHGICLDLTSGTNEPRDPRSQHLNAFSRLTEPQEAHEAEDHHPVQDVFGVADGRHRPAGSPVGGISVLVSREDLSVLEVRHVSQLFGGVGEREGGKRQTNLTVTRSQRAVSNNSHGVTWRRELVTWRVKADVPASLAARLLETRDLYDCILNWYELLEEEIHKWEIKLKEKLQKGAVSKIIPKLVTWTQRGASRLKNIFLLLFFFYYNTFFFVGVAFTGNDDIG